MKYRKYLTAITLAVLLKIATSPLAAHSAETMSPDLPRAAGPETPASGQIVEPSRTVLPREYAYNYLAERFGVTVTASKLNGMIVCDRQEHRLGKIEDLLFSLRDGRVICALVQPGGRFRHEKYPVAVPAKSFFLFYNGKAVANLAKSSLADAPEFLDALADSASLPGLLEESYRHFNQKIFWDKSEGLGPVCRSSQLLGMEVRNQAGENLGRVANLMVDLPTGRLIFAVIALDGAKDSLYSVPPEVLTVAANGNAVLLDEDRAKIAARAQSSVFFWDDILNPAWATVVYHGYGLEPDFAPVSRENSTREFVRARINGPTDLTAGRTDAEIQQSVVTAMIRDAAVNMYLYRRIRVQTEAGRVKLIGQVDNEAQREDLGTSVANVVGPENLDNGLTIRK